MFVEELRLHNWILFRDVNVQLGPVPIFVLGENYDDAGQSSNGSGKSLLCEAPFWILFEASRKGFSVKDAIGPFDSFCSGYIRINLGGHILEVERKRSEKGKQVVIILDGEDVTPYKNQEALIEEILSVPSKLFINACYQGHPDNEPFVSQTDSNLKRQVISLLSLERFDAYTSQASSKLKEVKAALEKHLADVSAHESKLSHLEQQMTFLVRQADEAKKNQELDRNRLLVDIRRFGMDEVRLQADIEGFADLKPLDDSLRERYDICNQNVNRARRNVETLTNTVQKAKRSLDSLNAKRDQAEKNKNNLLYDGHECEYCGSVIERSESLSKKRAQFESEFVHALGAAIEQGVLVERQSRNLENAKAELQTFQSELDLLKDQMDAYFENVNLYRQFDAKKAELQGVQSILEDKRSNLEGLDERLSGLLERNEAERHNVREQIEIRRAMLAESQSKVFESESLVEAWVKVSKAIQGVRDGIYNNFLISFETMVNEEFERLSDGGLQCELENTASSLKFLFRSAAQENPMSYHGFSKGERLRIDVAASNTLLNMVDAPLLIHDETFSVMDDAGLMASLERILERHEGRTVMFVSNKVLSEEFYHRCKILRCIKKGGEILVEEVDG